MRKTIALLALVGILALSAIAFGSPPTQKKKATKSSIVKISTASTAAETSAVAARDAEARTVETATQNNYNETRFVENAVVTDRHTCSPPESLNSGDTAKAAARLKETYVRPEGNAVGYALRR